MKRDALQIANAVPGEGQGDYYRYELPGKMTLPDRQLCQYALFNAGSVKVKRKWVLEGESYYYRSSLPGMRRGWPVVQRVEWKNDSRDGLGFPIPQGVVRFYQADRHGNMQFAGESRMPHTPVGESASLSPGESFLVTASRKQLRFERIPWRVAWSAARLIVWFGIPATLGMLMIPLGTGIVTRITAEFGDAAVAATAAAGRVEMIAFVVPMSIGIALTPFIGQNYGAKLYSRIRQGQRFVMRFATAFLLVSALVATVFSRQIAAFFSVEPEVQQIMSQYLRIVAWGLWGVEVHRFAGFIYTGCGRPAVAGWLNALRIGGLLIPFSLVAYWFRSLEGLFFARLAADVLAALIGWRLVSGMTRRLLQRSPTGPAE